MSRSEAYQKIESDSPKNEDLQTQETLPFATYEKIVEATEGFWLGMSKQVNGFWDLTAKGTESIMANARKNSSEGNLADPESMKAMVEASLKMQQSLFEMYTGAMQSGFTFMLEESNELLAATQKAVETGDWAPVDEYWEHQVEALVNMEQTPEAKEKLKEELGYHFENKEEYEQVAETDRAVLYSVSPTAEGSRTDMTRKPIIIVSPYLLGDNISALLPRQGISYAHTYANEGAPTYVVHYKDILKTRAVQDMTGEDFTTDLQQFCRTVREIHGKPATINGICQGGYLSLAALLSGEINKSEDGEGAENNVDSFVSCVTPVDLSKCKQFEELSSMLPPALRTVNASAITLPGGGKVVPGESASSGMLWKDIERNNPISSFLSKYKGAKRGKPSVFAQAVEEWLSGYAPLPIEIARLSELSSTTPVNEAGDLPIELFGKKLNLNYMREAGIKWHAMIGTKDDVVELSAAKAAQGTLQGYDGYTEAEVPTGHIGLLTNPRFKDVILDAYRKWDKEGAEQK